jgi:hypothetical protein
VNQTQLAFVISYGLITGYFFVNWLRFSLRHPSSSPEDKFLSFVMFVISTILWPLVIPMSLIEIFKTRKIDLSAVVPVILAIFAFSISFYLN